MNALVIGLTVPLLAMSALQDSSAQPAITHTRVSVTGQTATGSVPGTGIPLTDSMVLPMFGSTDHLEGRIAFLKVELKITAAQLPKWNTFIATARANAEEEAQAERAQLEGSRPTLIGDTLTYSNLLQRLDAHDTQLARHLRMLERITAALTPLYDSFSAEQRKMADSLASGLTVF